MYAISNPAVKAALFILLFLLLLVPATGQWRTDWGRDANRPRRNPANAKPTTTSINQEFSFVRIIYDSPHSPYNYAFGGAWRVDFPDADENFIEGLHDWASTNLSIASKPVQIRPTDPRLFDFPFAYIVEPGHMELTEDDAAALREYLLRGGFLFLDDFHGDLEWERALGQLKMIFPEYEPKDLPLTHAIFHSYFDLDQVVQVPGVASLVRGVTYEKGGVTPHYMGVEDSNGRLMIFMTRNCDLGDAWEWINDSRYPAQYGFVAYKVGINAVIYSMSH